MIEAASISDTQVKICSTTGRNNTEHSCLHYRGHENLKITRFYEFRIRFKRRRTEPVSLYYPDIRIERKWHLITCIELFKCYFRKGLCIYFTPALLERLWPTLVPTGFLNNEYQGNQMDWNWILPVLLFISCLSVKRMEPSSLWDNVQVYFSVEALETSRDVSTYE